MTRSNIAILNIKSVDCCCIISRIIKSEAANSMHNIDLTKKGEHYMDKEILIFGDIKIEKK